MGLFKKKQAPLADETPAGGLPAADPKKKSKATVDPVDFLNLRSEMLDLKARLEVAEQAKAVVEARLAALDATTTALSTERLGGDDVRARIDDLEAKFDHQLDGAPVATETITTVAIAEIDPELLARIDSLTARVDEFTSAPAPPPPPPFTAAAESGRPDPVLLARVDELATRLDEVAAAQHMELSALIEPTDGPAGLDADALARIDELAQRVDGVDQTVTHASEQFAGQLAQLNARVVAQAELGAQLSALRDRLDELQREQPAAAAAPTEPDPQIGQLAERMAANDEAVRRTAEHLANLEQRIDSVSTELAKQLSELGRDIDGLAARADDGTETDDDTVEQLVEQLVDQLRTGQVKLANEQARYEIAFRQDLAALAEQVRRGR